MKTCILSFYLVLLIGTWGCADSKIDPAQKNKEIAAKAFEIVAAGDYNGMDQYIAQDYMRHCQATPELNIESLEAFKKFIKMDRQSIPDQKLTVKMLIAEGDLVAFWASYSGTQTGQMGPFPPSNKYAELDFAGMHRIEDGKIAETWITWDNMAILSQLGHLPPPVPDDSTE